MISLNKPNDQEVSAANPNQGYDTTNCNAGALSTDQHSLEDLLLPNFSTLVAIFPTNNSPRPVRCVTSEGLAVVLAIACKSAHNVDFAKYRSDEGHNQ